MNEKNKWKQKANNIRKVPFPPVTYIIKIDGLLLETKKCTLYYNGNKIKKVGERVINILEPSVSVRRLSCVAIN